MNRVLEGLGGVAAKRHWVFIVGWLVIFGVAVSALGLMAQKKPPATMNPF